MRTIRNRAQNNMNKYHGAVLLKHRINTWDRSFQNYNENDWMNSITEKINTGLTVTQEVCDNVITPLVEKQLNGLNKEFENS